MHWLDVLNLCMLMDFDNVVYKVQAVVGYALTDTGILFNVFMDKEFDSIVNFDPE